MRACQREEAGHKRDRCDGLRLPSKSALELLRQKFHSLGLKGFLRGNNRNARDRCTSPTPQYAWPLLSERLGTEVWVKHENQTPTGSFQSPHRRRTRRRTHEARATNAWPDYRKADPEQCPRHRRRSRSRHAPLLHRHAQRCGRSGGSWTGCFSAGEGTTLRKARSRRRHRSQRRPRCLRTRPNG